VTGAVCPSVCGVACSCCSLSSNDIGDAGASAIAAALVHLPQLQVLKYVARRWGPCSLLSPVVGFEQAVCRYLLWRRFCAVSWCSLQSNGIGDTGASAVAVALAHVPLLQVLRYAGIWASSALLCYTVAWFAFFAGCWLLWLCAALASPCVFRCVTRV
jgi:hypothetical protein